MSENLPSEIVIVEGRGSASDAWPFSVAGAAFVLGALGLGSLSWLFAVPLLLPAAFFGALVVRHARSQTRIVASARGLRGESMTYWTVPQRFECAWSDLLGVYSDPANILTRWPELPRNQQTAWFARWLGIETRHRLVLFSLGKVSLSAVSVHRRLARIVFEGLAGSRPSDAEIASRREQFARGKRIGAALLDDRGLRLDDGQVATWDAIVAAHFLAPSIEGGLPTLELELVGGRGLRVGGTPSELVDIASSVTSRVYEPNERAPSLEQPNASALLLSLDMGSAPPRSRRRVELDA
ncbi:MAG: hypothetical protein U0271_21730 [Polyangiaceae bacterium]